MTSSLAAGLDKSTNLSRAKSKILEASSAGASIIVLPEFFNSPIGHQHFPKNAETLFPNDSGLLSGGSTAGAAGVGAGPEEQSSKKTESSQNQSQDPGESHPTSPTYALLSQLARSTKTYLIGGSIPEYVPSTQKYHNTSLTFSPRGTLVAVHRKVHLFDIDIPGKVTFRESDGISAGDQVTVVDADEYGKIGVGICYDVRFPELATVAARRGAFLLVYPGAFTLTTGLLHWELLARARAVDHQLYVAVCSPARDMETPDGYRAWGHSMLVDPNGQVVVEAQHGPDILYADLSPDRIDEVRRNIPLQTQRRWDVYPDISKMV